MLDESDEQGSSEEGEEGGESEFSDVSGEQSSSDEKIIKKQALSKRVDMDDEPDLQQKRNLEVLRQLEKAELGDESASDIDAVLDRIHDDEDDEQHVESKRQVSDLEKSKAV